MAVLVKICGINSSEAADAAVRAGVDLVGLTFHPGSPRNVSLDQAAALAERMRGRARLVAMTSGASDAALGEIMRAAAPDFVQLHGGESPVRAAEIRSRFGVAVIKVVSVAEAGDLRGVEAYEDASDMLMFDAKAPAGATREGGHGAVFDWQIIRGRRFTRPWLLAGGLTPENVARAIQISGAPGVDVSSGVEDAPGLKSADKIAAFVAAARGAQVGAAA